MNEAAKKWQDNSKCHKHSEGRHTFVAAMTTTKNYRDEVILWMCSHCRQYSHTQEIQDANAANHDEMYHSVDV